jgi:hypothetical protein
MVARLAPFSRKELAPIDFTVAMELTVSAAMSAREMVTILAAILWLIFMVTPDP